MTLKTVDDVVRAGFCSGCGLCESIAAPGKVSVSLSAGGYLRPTTLAPLDDAELVQFRSACPGVGLSHDAGDSDQPRHAVWGPLISCNTGYACDSEVRHQGSSGGVISALAVYLLETGQIDFVAQNVADPSDPLGNALQQSRTRGDVLRAAGSRYGPAAPLRALRQLLDSGQRFAFVGKPCDVAALRSFARSDSRVRKQVPFMLSFMCAGVPGRAGTEAVLKRLGVAVNEVASFRYRGDGWPGKARAVTHSGEVREMDYATSWGQVLNRHLQFRCKICPDGTGEFADVVCADAWYGDNGYPEFDERDGRSVVLGRTSTGTALIENAARDGAIVIEPLAIEELSKMQPYQRNRKQVVLGRLLGTRLATGQAPTFHNLALGRASLSAKPVDWLRNAAGTYRRAKAQAE